MFEWSQAWQMSLIYIIS